MTLATSRAPVAGQKKGSTFSRSSIAAQPPRLSTTNQPSFNTESIPTRPAKRQKVDVIVISDDEDDKEETALEKKPDRVSGHIRHTVSPEGQKRNAAAHRKEHYKVFIRENVVPHISCAVTKLPSDRYQINKIAQKVSSDKPSVASPSLNPVSFFQ